MSDEQSKPNEDASYISGDFGSQLRSAFGNNAAEIFSEMILVQKEQGTSITEIGNVVSYLAGKGLIYASFIKDDEDSVNKRDSDKEKGQKTLRAIGDLGAATLSPLTDHMPTFYYVLRGNGVSDSDSDSDARKIRGFGNGLLAAEDVGPLSAVEIGKAIPRLHQSLSGLGLHGSAETATAATILQIGGLSGQDPDATIKDATAFARALHTPSVMNALQAKGIDIGNALASTSSEGPEPLMGFLQKILNFETLPTVPSEQTVSKEDFSKALTLRNLELTKRLGAIFGNNENAIAFAEMYLSKEREIAASYKGVKEFIENKNDSSDKTQEAINKNKVSSSFYENRNKNAKELKDIQSSSTAFARLLSVMGGELREKMSGIPALSELDRLDTVTEESSTLASLKYAVFTGGAMGIGYVLRKPIGKLVENFKRRMEPLKKYIKKFIGRFKGRNEGNAPTGRGNEGGNDEGGDLPAGENELNPEENTAEEQNTNTGENIPKSEGNRQNSDERNKENKNDNKDEKNTGNDEGARQNPDGSSSQSFLSQYKWPLILGGTALAIGAAAVAAPALLGAGAMGAAGTAALGTAESAAMGTAGTAALGAAARFIGMGALRGATLRTGLERIGGQLLQKSGQELVKSGGYLKQGAGYLQKALGGLQSNTPLTAMMRGPKPVGNPLSTVLPSLKRGLGGNLLGNGLMAASLAETILSNKSDSLTMSTAKSAEGITNGITGKVNVTVSFKNMPTGARTEITSSGNVQVSQEVGFTQASSLSRS